MAEIKVLDLDGLNYFASKLDTKYVKVGTVEEGAQVNKIETVKVNGAPVEIADKAVNIDLSAYALKNDVAKIYRPMGSVATYADLPANARIGDVYDVKTDGANYAWVEIDGVAKWDALGGTVDLSNFYTKTEVNGLVSPKADKTYVDGELANKANATHSHAIADVTGLQGALDAKLNSADLSEITNAEIDTIFA